MRPYKAKRLDNDEWIEGWLIACNTGSYMVESDVNVTDFLPEYHSEGIGCGIEDRGITDRYQAAEYGFEKGVNRTLELIPEFIQVNPSTVCQQIGLQDEDGNEIYDNMAIEYDDTEIGSGKGAGVVTYFTDQTLVDSPCYALWTKGGYLAMPINKKIIGNEIDNPEILGAKNV